jgi:hypothetical protein
MDQKQSTTTVRGRGEAYYRELLTEQESSGQSLRAFAAERGLSPWTLYGWRVKLGRARPRGGARGSRRSGPRGCGAGFVAVDVVSGNRSGRDIEVVLADGCRVCVPRDMAIEKLTQLVRALRSC